MYALRLTPETTIQGTATVPLGKKDNDGKELVETPVVWAIEDPD